MTSSELNLKLLKSFPEIYDVYREETAWQDGDETGSHVVYADVFVPFIKEQLAKSNKSVLVKLFEYIEELIVSDDEYANEVGTLSVVETLVFDEEIDHTLLVQFAKASTLKTIKDILQNIEK